MKRIQKQRADWLMTARQSIPRIVSLLGKLEPTFTLRDVRQIDQDFLREHEIGGLIWDVDGTLMTYHAMAVDDQLKSHMDGLFAQSDLRHAILSNCDEIRFEELKQIFPDLPLIRGYQNHEGLVYRTARGGSDTHSKQEVELLLERGFRQIRKPSGALIEEAVRALEMPAAHCIMIGDQHLTDVASANLGGIRSIKVETFGRETFPRSIRFTQRLERLLYKVVTIL